MRGGVEGEKSRVKFACNETPRADYVNLKFIRRRESSGAEGGN